MSDFIEHNKLNYKLIGNKTNGKFKFQCLHCDTVFEKVESAYISNHYKGSHCPTCKLEDKKMKYIKDVESYFNSSLTVNNIYLKDYANRKRFFVDVTCKEHGVSYKAPLEKVKTRKHCCSKSESMVEDSAIQYTLEEFEAKVKLIFGNKFEVLELHNKQALFKCNNCKQTFKKNKKSINSGNVSRLCVNCEIGSFGERAIKHILKSNQILFESQFPVKDNNVRYFYDFKLLHNNRKILIEYDGIQHFEEVTYFSETQDHSTLRARDRAKNLWAENNDYELFRISYLSDNLPKIADKLAMILNRPLIADVSLFGNYIDFDFEQIMYSLKEAGIKSVSKKLNLPHSRLYSVLHLAGFETYKEFEDKIVKYPKKEHFFKFKDNPDIFCKVHNTSLKELESWCVEAGFNNLEHYYQSARLNGFVFNQILKNYPELHKKLILEEYSEKNYELTLTEFRKYNAILLEYQKRLDNPTEKILSYLLNHTVVETKQMFNTSSESITKLVLDLGYADVNSMRKAFKPDEDISKELLKFLESNTLLNTLKKFKISSKTLYKHLLTQGYGSVRDFRNK